jgi:threonine synthase
MGDGCIISGQWKAFKELRLLGETERVPRLLGVQASGCKPIVDACVECCDVTPVEAATIADSIRVGEPRNWRKALRALEDSGGTAVSVTDEEIVSAMLMLSREAGVFAEPAGATGLAGLRAAIEQDIVGRGETVAVLVTGSGLKDPSSLDGALDIADIPADVEAVAKHMST